jgi:signal transduction histidine kinase
LFFCNIRLDLTRVVGTICVMADNKEAVRSATQTNLLKSEAETERLAAIGKFTAKIAHELNNPLDGILRYINLASRSVELDNAEKLNEYLGQSRQGILRMVKIVRELLEFSRSHYLPVEEPAPIEQIIEDAIKTCTSRGDTPPVQIARDFSSGLPKFPAVNLFQVFCNLIKNALDSMPDGGTLEITTTAESNGGILIEFRDTGHGFDPADTDALFEPFFTTKTQGRGTGLGLAICKDLVARHGGYISAANRAEAGSVFTVHLPIPAE